MTMLVRNHFYNTLYEQQKARDWSSTTVRGVKDYVGQRLGVLGYGSIGRQGMFLVTSLYTTCDCLAKS